LIPISHLRQWSAQAPWPSLQQIEQDLIISRALCDLFNSEALRGKIAFRGGTAIHKLLFPQPLRYSEDIDLVQTTVEPIGQTLNAIRVALSWLGKAKSDQAIHSAHLTFAFTPEEGGGHPMKLKVEINTREQQNLFPWKTYPFTVISDWHTSRTEIVAFEAEELFGTKLRALLQRNKNRDLFDLHAGLLQLGMDTDRVITCFNHYIGLESRPIRRANAEERMLKKLSRSLVEDIAPLLPPGVSYTPQDAIMAFGKVWKDFITRLPGEPWKLTQPTIDMIRKEKIPSLLDDLQ
jgi:predicted nucleotidyltransferase component of viral defense system